MAEELVRYYVKRLEDIVARRRVLKAFYPDLPEEEIRCTLLQTGPDIRTLRAEVEADRRFAEQILELLSNPAQADQRVEVLISRKLKQIIERLGADPDRLEELAKGILRAYPIIQSSLDALGEEEDWESVLERMKRRLKEEGLYGAPTRS